MDYPNSKKAKKVFLCLFVGDGGAQQVPKGLDGEEVDGDGHGDDGDDSGDDSGDGGGDGGDGVDDG